MSTAKAPAAPSGRICEKSRIISETFRLYINAFNYNFFMFIQLLTI